MPTPITPKISKTTVADSYELGHITDSSVGRTVSAQVSTAFGLIDLVLWQGEEYDDIGDWTQDDAEARIMEKLQEKYSA